MEHTFPTPDQEVPHWAYEGSHGPEHWGSLCSEYRLARDGKCQSPINLASYQTEAAPGGLNVVYRLAPARIENNGHSVQLAWAAGTLLQSDGAAYDLVQLHFHAPSEHTINGVSYPLEMNLVHRRADGQLAVVGVLFREDGKANDFLGQFVDDLPDDVGVKGEELQLSPDALLRQIAGSGYFGYEGSVTTPPCSEGVQWAVVSEVKPASASQIAKIASYIPGRKNNRPVQPTNAREVRLFTGSGSSSSYRQSSWKLPMPSRSTRYANAFAHHHGCCHGLGVAHLFPAERQQVPHWAYSGPEGPEYWGDLCEQYRLAKDGKSQSPINLASYEAVPRSGELGVSYRPTPARIENNGHSVQLDWEAGSLALEGGTYQLVQFHFHTPSEHTIDGVSYPLEMHLVHRHDNGRLAVVGILFKEAARTNDFLDQFSEKLPEAVDGKQMYALLQPYLLLRSISKSGFFAYEGSLTTPPCSEGVHWVVVGEVQSASAAQVARFRSIIPGRQNNRPVQPINGREVAFVTRDLTSA